jgi:site-specific recombinase XerD
VAALRRNQPMAALTREWLSDLKYLRRSEQTIRWYGRKVDAFLRETGVTSLDDLTTAGVKAYLTALADRGLSDESVHGVFATLKAFANWSDREGYAVDKGLLRMRGPAVAQKERQVYSSAQLDAVLRAAPAGWPLVAIQVLLGTGMRVAELCALRLEDFEDDGELGFLKIQKGKGGKFRRVPTTERLRREIRRYINRVRPEGASEQLLLMADGRPLRVGTVGKMLNRLGTQLGLHLHAHRFRHTFATMYVENGGDIERLRKILGHSTYAMILRYVHLNKQDLALDIEARAPF